MLLSPLRYPGGKAKLFEYFAKIIEKNGLYSCMYCEPYAGGAGLAFKLLSTGFVSQVALNDIDPSIYAFWKAVFEANKELCDLIDQAELSIDEWYRQKETWTNQDPSNFVKLGFSAFYLNRTNRSGIIEGAGPIGGYKQAGNWRIDVRFNREQLRSQIEALYTYRSRVSISNLDAVDYLNSVFGLDDSFCYLDPPYYVKGSKLYRNHYNHNDHCQIRDILLQNNTRKWVVSYDDVPEIRALYSNLNPISYDLDYSAGPRSTGKEVIYFSRALNAPEWLSVD